MKYTINKKQYTCKVFLSEIPLKDAIAISKIGIDESTFDDLRTYNMTEDVKKYIISVLEILSDTPNSILQKLPDIELEVLYEKLVPFLECLYRLDFNKFEPYQYQEIEFKGKKYKAPESLEIEEDIMPAHKLSCKYGVEAMNIAHIMSKLKNEGIHLLKYLCAIYWLEEGEEQYDEEKVAKKAKLFEDLPMDIVISTFFFTYYYFISCILNIQLSLNKPSLIKRIRIKIMNVIIIGYTHWQKLKSRVLSKR